MNIDEHLREIADPAPIDMDTALMSVRRRVRARHRLLLTTAALLATMAVVAGVVAWDHASPARPRLADSGPGQAGSPSSTPGQVLATRLIKADSARVTDPSVGAGSVPAVVRADSSFGLDLLAQLTHGSEANTFLSPYSIATALTMTYAGARGATATQLADALGITALSDRVHEGRNALDLRLTAPRKQLPSGLPGQSPASGQPLSFQVANSLWGQTGFPFLHPFLETLAKNYDAGMNTVDFARATEDARVAINDWVAGHTNHRITELLPRGIIDDLTRLVLVNAISFKASWLRPFDSKATANQTFTRPDLSKVTVPMMHRKIRTSYTHTSGWQAARLPYLGGASMTVLLPDQPGSTLDAATWNTIQRQPDDAIVTLAMPKFSYSAHTSLADNLKSLGARDLFDGAADLSGIDGRQDLYVKAVAHQATVSVDEHGTEATASTAVIGEAMSAPPRVTLTLNRPFTFVIQDDNTGEMLFLGRTTDPTQH